LTGWILMSLVTTPALLLRSHPYSESSRVLRFFTRDAGLVGVMARGIRKSGARDGSGLESFAGGTLTFYARSTRDLQTFKEFSTEKPRRGLGASPERLGGASLVAELVLRHAGEESNEPLFAALDQAFDRIEASDPASVIPVVISGAWSIVRSLGYGPVLESCVHCDEPLGVHEVGRFDFSAGGVRCPRCSVDAVGPRVGPGAREQLRALVAGEALPSPLLRPRAHLQLLSDFVTQHVSGTRPLESFSFLARLLPDDHA
jgi:DNA repair protein RecO (recombination protein O)